MAEQVHAFRSTGSDSDGGSIAAALEPRFTVRPESPKRVVRTWLDTFDWRLHRAGLTLECADAGDGWVLTLQLPDGALISCPIPEPHWPATIEDLPDCPLRDRVADTIRPRALLPVATAGGTVAVDRILNADQKTVARIVTETPDQGERWLHVRPLRGYGADADRIARRLAEVADLTPAGTTAYAEALARADRTPENYRSNRAPALSPQLPAAVAIATVLQGFADTMTDNVAGVTDAIDIEFLHDFRVAVRRTRSVLKLAGDVLPDDLADRFAPEFRWLGDLTTPVRDLDVYLYDMPRMAAGLTSADPGDLDPFRAFLARRRTAERRRLVRGLRSRRFQKLMEDWGGALGTVVSEHTVVREHRPDGPSAGDLDRQRVDRAFRRVVVHGERLSVESPGEAVHTLRKRCKELRYLLEIFAPLHERSAQRRLVAELKRLQDALGEFQDGEVQREAIREFAGDMMDEGHTPAATVLAMGELAAQLEARQIQARAELQGRLQPFLSRKNRARVGALSGAAA